MRTSTPMDIARDSSLHDVAAHVPGAIDVLERRGLLLAGFQRTLADACERQGRDLGDVVDAIRRAAELARDRGETPLAALEPAELMLRIAREGHQRTFELAHLALSLARRLATHGDAPVLGRLAELLETLVVELHAHIEREERTLFVRVRALLRGAGPRPKRGELERAVHVMRLDHEATESLLDEMRARTDGYRAPDGASHLWRGLYELMIDLESALRRAFWLEEKLFFPDVLELG